MRLHGFSVQVLDGPFVGFHFVTVDVCLSQGDSNMTGATVILRQWVSAVVAEFIQEGYLLMALPVMSLGVWSRTSVLSHRFVFISLHCTCV